LGDAAPPAEVSPKAENTSHSANEKASGPPAPRPSFGQAIKELFGRVAEVLTGKPTPALVARRRRRDEGERGFRMYAAPIAEVLPAPVQRATDFLWDVLDWLNPTSNSNQPHPHEQLDQCASVTQNYPTLDL